MSPISNAIERLASRHGVPPLEALEYFLGRLEFYGGNESAAIAATELWAKLWISLKGEVGPQLKLKADSL